MNPRVVAVIAALVVLALGTAGAARGYFAASAGSGQGALPVPTLTGVTIGPAAVAGGLRPGGTADLAVVATNANPQPVRIGALLLDPGAGAVSADATGCVNAAVSVGRQTNGGAGWVIPARNGGVDGSLTIRVPGAVAMGSGADDGCQGAVLTLRVQAGA